MQWYWRLYCMPLLCYVHALAMQSDRTSRQAIDTAAAHFLNGRLDRERERERERECKQPMSSVSPKSPINIAEWRSSSLAAVALPSSSDFCVLETCRDYKMIERFQWPTITQSVCGACALNWHALSIRILYCLFPVRRGRRWSRFPGR